MVRKGHLVAFVLAVALGLGTAPAAGAAGAHSSPCHLKKTCPSDHASYRWRGLLCVKPTSDKRNATFKRVVIHAGKRYYCKR